MTSAFSLLQQKTYFMTSYSCDEWLGVIQRNTLSPLVSKLGLYMKLNLTKVISSNVTLLWFKVL